MECLLYAIIYWIDDDDTDVTIASDYAIATTANTVTDKVTHYNTIRIRIHIVSKSKCACQDAVQQSEHVY